MTSHTIPAGGVNAADSGEGRATTAAVLSGESTDLRRRPTPIPFLDDRIETPTMTATVEAPPITEPGVVLDMPEDAYHAHPALSSTLARAILDPGCPAKMRQQQLTGSPVTEAKEFGSAFHTELLGVGTEVVVVDAPDWKTKAAQEVRKEARARGAVALLRSKHDEVQAMVAALRADKVAGPIFEPGTGVAEQSLFWQDERTGVWCRARLDWATPSGGIFDPKSTISCWPEDIARTIAKYRYHQQASFYLMGAKALGLEIPQKFTFVFQEKSVPFLPVVVRADARALEIGRERNRAALDLYAKCLREDSWPGYAQAPITVALPTYVEIEHDMAFSSHSTDGW